MTKMYQQNLDCRTEFIKIGISEHGTVPSDKHMKDKPIKDNVVATMKVGFSFTIGYYKLAK